MAQLSDRDCHSNFRAAVQHNPRLILTQETCEQHLGFPAGWTDPRKRREAQPADGNQKLSSAEINREPNNFVEKFADVHRAGRNPEY
jgi:hypothetical protein